jgi:hypothetical protein
MLDGFTLRIEHAWFQGYVNFSFHLKCGVRNPNIPGVANVTINERKILR